MKTIKIPQIAYPKVRPENSVAEYKFSQNFEKMTKLYPEFDVVRHNEIKSNLALLQIRLRGAEETLAHKRQHLSAVRANLDKQWEDLELKEKQLRENFINFNTFVQENLEKRERADKKIVEENFNIEQRQKDIDTYLQTYYDLNLARHDMERKITEYYLYEEYLDKVVEHATEFTSIQDMINRYLALVFAKKHLAQVQEDNFRDLETARNDMVKLMAEKHMEIVGLNNQIANLQSRYEIANFKSLESEQLVIRIKNQAVFMINEIDEVKSSIWNLYEHMVHAKGYAMEIDKEDVEAQMMYIKRTLTELCKINNLLRKRSKPTSRAKAKTN